MTCIKKLLQCFNKEGVLKDYESHRHICIKYDEKVLYGCLRSVSDLLVTCCLRINLKLLTHLIF